MSIFVSRPKVNTVAVAQVPPQVVRAAKLIAAMLPALDAATQAALSEIDQANLPVPALMPRLEFPKRVSLPTSLPGRPHGCARRRVYVRRGRELLRRRRSIRTQRFARAVGVNASVA